MKPSHRPPAADLDEMALGYEAATPHLTLATLPAPRVRRTAVIRRPALRSIRGVFAVAFAMLASTA